METNPDNDTPPAVTPLRRETGKNKKGRVPEEPKRPDKKDASSKKAAAPKVKLGKKDGKGAAKKLEKLAARAPLLGGKALIKWLTEGLIVLEYDKEDYEGVEEAFSEWLVSIDAETSPLTALVVMELGTIAVAGMAAVEKKKVEMDGLIKAQEEEERRHRERNPPAQPGPVVEGEKISP